MCLYDNVRYICSDEEHTLAELCDAATGQCAQLRCAPHIRHVLFSTSVCDLCGIAWEQSALTEDAYDQIITPLLAFDRKRSCESGSYFPTDALFVASPPNTPMRRLSLGPSPTPSEVATPIEEVSEGMFNPHATGHDSHRCSLRTLNKDLAVRRSPQRAEKPSKSQRQIAERLTVSIAHCRIRNDRSSQA